MQLQLPRCPEEGIVCATRQCSIYLGCDGLVRATDDTLNEILSGWRNVAAVDAGNCGQVIGLQNDGFAVSTTAETDVSLWLDLVAVGAGWDHYVGLKSDGTVVAVGDNTCGQTDVYDWSGIVDISVGDNHTLGLKADGTVVAAGDNTYGQCDVSDWTQVQKLSTASNFTLGLRNDGTVLVAGRPMYEDWEQALGPVDVSRWTDIVDIAAGENNLYGLRRDGTVVAQSMTAYYTGADVSSWQGVAAISASDHLLGLRGDGTILAMGGNMCGECDVEYLTGGIPEETDHEHVYMDIFSEIDGHVHKTCIDCLDEKLVSAIPLTWMNVISDSNPSTSDEDVTFGTWTSGLGTEIPDSIKFWVVNRSGYSTTEYVELDVGSGGYTQLTGNLIGGIECEYGAGMELRIYADGVLIGEYTDLSEMSYNAFGVDISGANVLRIECTGTTHAFAHCIVQGWLH